MTDRNAARIRALNDQFRKNPRTGRTMITDGVNALDDALQARILAAVASFDAFTADNDPHGEHDFGSFEIEGERIMWKFDYYADKSLTYGSEDPADPQKSVRVLTIMLAEEY